MELERSFPTLVLKSEVESEDLTYNAEVDISLDPSDGLADKVSKIKAGASWESAGNNKFSLTAEKENGSGVVSVDLDGDLPDRSMVVCAKGTVTSNDVSFTSAGFTKTFDSLDGTVNLSPTYYPGDAAVPFDVALDYSTDDTKLTATVDSDMSKTIELEKSFDSTTATYKYENDEHEIAIDYSMDNTDIKLTATKDDQKVKISQQIGDNTISPTFESNGDITVAWEKALGDDNKITTTVTNSNDLTVEWEDQDWVVNAQAKLVGGFPEDVEIHMKREINF